MCVCFDMVSWAVSDGIWSVNLPVKQKPRVCVPVCVCACACVRACVRACVCEVEDGRQSKLSAFVVKDILDEEGM